MKEFIDKLISRLEEAKVSANRRNAFDSEVSYACAIDIVNKLAEEYKEECNLDCDKLLFAYSDLLRRFQNAEETVICEFSGNISKETEELEAECEELLSQFKEILYSANTSQNSEAEYKVSEMPTGWIPCSERLPEKAGDCLVTQYAKKSIFNYCDAYRVSIIFFDDKNGWWDDISNSCGWNIIAWQPLPAPYTEGE